MQSSIRKIGRKGKEWIKAKSLLVKVLKKNPNFTVNGGTVFGICPDCKHHHQLTPDHKIKRSQGGDHTAENIEWVCNESPCFCHSKRDNFGDPNEAKPKNSGKYKKANWQKDHSCKHCGFVSSSLICISCGKLTIDSKTLNSQSEGLTLAGGSSL